MPNTDLTICNLVAHGLSVAEAKKRLGITDAPTDQPPSGDPAASVGVGGGDAPEGGPAKPTKPAKPAEPPVDNAPTADGGKPPWMP